MSRSGPNAEEGQFMMFICIFLTAVQKRIPVNDVVAPANISARGTSSRDKFFAEKTVASRDNLEGEWKKKKTQEETKMKRPDGKS